MRILALDTTTAAGSVAVLNEVSNELSVPGVVGTRSDEAYSSRLFRQVEFLLAELKLHISDFDLFAVASGPGTFTGLRVGLTAVKGWAEVLGRPIAAVSALEAIAHQAQSTDETAGAKRIVSIADARRGQVYGGIYEPHEGRMRRIGEDVVMSPAEFWAYLSAHKVHSSAAEPLAVATSSASFVFRLLLESPYASARVKPVSALLAPAVGEIGWRAAQRGETCDALTLDAHYVRRSDAEVLFGS